MRGVRCRRKPCCSSRGRAPCEGKRQPLCDAVRGRKNEADGRGSNRSGKIRDALEGLNVGRPAGSGPRESTAAKGPAKALRSERPSMATTGPLQAGEVGALREFRRRRSPNLQEELCARRLTSWTDFPPQVEPTTQRRLPATGLRTSRLSGCTAAFPPRPVGSSFVNTLRGVDAIYEVYIYFHCTHVVLFDAHFELADREKLGC